MWLTFWATFRRDFYTMQRAYPWAFFLGHILSGIYIVLFSYLTYHFMFQGKLNDSFMKLGKTDDYLSYVILGAVFYSFAVSLLMIVSRTLITELREGTLDVLLLTPSSRQGYFLGAAVQGMLRVGLEFIAIFMFGLLFGLQFREMNIAAVSLLLLIFFFSIFAQALVLGAFMLYFRDTYLTQNTLFIFMSLVSGVFFPVGYLPAFLQTISLFMPLSHGLSAFRLCMIEGGNVTAIQSDLMWLLGLGVVYFVIGVMAIKRMEKYVIEKYFA
ncbi:MULTISPECIES: ABC transporter permease [unclassified Bacillus (in: firmicutes)]|uniref:ABC transporter permease n=1 Tax=unclassified Bacillus (in: firmicutes) TaxID=185979 RepID=UPI00232E00ED|nr:ABC transporter permease [Bacillus sp. BP-3]MDC2865732.1 ABC transporter permease [Bacillus sp. BP-3]